MSDSDIYLQQFDHPEENPVEILLLTSLCLAVQHASFFLFFFLPIKNPC